MGRTLMRQQSDFASHPSRKQRVRATFEGGDLFARPSRTLWSGCDGTARRPPEGPVDFAAVSAELHHAYELAVAKQVPRSAPCLRYEIRRGGPLLLRCRDVKSPILCVSELFTEYRVFIRVLGHNLYTGETPCRHPKRPFGAAARLLAPRLPQLMTGFPKELAEARRSRLDAKN